MDFAISKTYPNYLYSPETNFTLSQSLNFKKKKSTFGFLAEVSVSPATTLFVF